MKRVLLTIICLLFCFVVKAQSQYTCRYWYDQNFAQAVTTTFSDNTWQAELDVSALGTGVHFLHIHVADTSMSWGPSQSFLFIKTDPTEQGLSGLTYHCWFDEDFEHQQVNSVGEGSFLLDVSGLSDGIHFVHIMLKGGDYSSTRSYMFMKMPVSPMEEWQYRCWFDWDYTTLQTGVVGGSYFLVDVSWLPIGQHTMTMQLDNGSLTPARTYEFYRMPIITVEANPTEDGTPICQVDDTICTLTAIPGIGYHFLNWTKDGEEVTTDDTYSFTMTEDETYVANFEINSYEITVDATPSVGGSAAGAGIYNHFASCTLTATPNIGYHFVNWTKDSLEVSTDAEYTFEVDGPGDYVAHFILNSYDITATADPAGAGTISGAGTYNHFSNCTLTATAATGYTFQNWTLDSVVVSTETEYSFEVSGAAAYVAHFILNSYDITATTDPAGAGTISGAGTYNHFSTCTLTATAATGYTFQNWTLDGEVVSTETEYSFEVSGAAAYVAHFTLNSYDITATVDPAEAGTVSGTGTYNHFSTCTLTATPNEDYAFVNWTKDGEEVSTEASYSFTVTEEATYVANFAIIAYHFTTTGNWSSVSNWRCGALPGTNDEVFIDAPCQLNQDATVAALTVSNGQSLTLQSGKTLTVTGNLINTATTGLVIEDGAQLVHNVANVQATVKKLISPFNGTDDGWHLIALPLTGTNGVDSVAHLLEGQYDLYGYDEATTYWKNKKTTGSGFTVLQATKGYLYANGEEVTFGFSGTLENSSATITVPLSFTDGAHLSGFNLVGNPFPCNAYIDREYFVLTSDGTDINPEPIPATTPIPPCTAVFVKAVAEGETVVFTRVAP